MTAARRGLNDNPGGGASPPVIAESTQLIPTAGALASAGHAGPDQPPSRPVGMHVLLDPAATRLPGTPPLPDPAHRQIPAGHGGVTASTDLLCQATTGGRRRARRHRRTTRQDDPIHREQHTTNRNHSGENRALSAADEDVADRRGLNPRWGVARQRPRAFEPPNNLTSEIVSDI